MLAFLGDLQDSGTLRQKLTFFVKFRQEWSRFDMLIGPAEKWSECLLDLPGSLEDVLRCVYGSF